MLYFTCCSRCQSPTCVYQLASWLFLESPTHTSCHRRSQTNSDALTLTDPGERTQKSCPDSVVSQSDQGSCQFQSINSIFCSNSFQFLSFNSNSIFFNSFFPSVPSVMIKFKFEFPLHFHITKVNHKHYTINVHTGDVTACHV